VIGALTLFIRSAPMIDEARRAAEDVAQAVNQSAQNAQLTAEVGHEARRATEQGVTAAERATDAMRSVPTPPPL
jgi:methyl-accepting chemotaxis protein